MSPLARQCRFTVLDFETTGTLPGHPEEPWQAAFCRIENSALTPDHREDYLRIATTRPFSPYAPGRHAKIRDILAQAPTPAECFPAWRPWLTDCILVAHNAPTERRILQKIAPLHQFPPWVDTLPLSRRALPALGDYTLSNVCAALSLEPRLRTLCPARDWHDALFDAIAAALLLETLLALPDWQNVSLAALTTCR